MFDWRVGQIQKINSGMEKVRGGGISCRINLMKNDQTSCYRLSLSKSYIELIIIEIFTNTLSKIHTTAASMSQTFSISFVAHDTHPRIFAVLELFFWICPTSCEKCNGPSLTLFFVEIFNFIGY